MSPEPEKVSQRNFQRTLTFNEFEACHHSVMRTQSIPTKAPNSTWFFWQSRFTSHMCRQEMRREFSLLRSLFILGSRPLREDALHEDVGPRAGKMKAIKRITDNSRQSLFYLPSCPWR